MASFVYNGGELEVSEDMKKAFNTDGYIVVKGLWREKELSVVEEALTGEDAITQYAYGNEDKDGKEARMCIWSYTGNDTTGTIARTRKMAYTAEQLIGGEVYHYHSKLMMKEAHSGGRFHWHQDYGYWYNFAFLFPDMITAFVALDKCDEENGCLQVIRGSHRCGRIGHGVMAGQVGADESRVKDIQTALDTVYVPLSPGDTLFFHANLLHCSAPNTSPRRRWALLSCYSRADNKPYDKVICSEYRPLEMTDNEAVLRQGVNRDLDGKEITMKVNNEYKVVRP